MDPISVAGNGASIFGLIHIFKSEKGANDTLDEEAFITWLNDKRHTQIVEEIHDNHKLSLAIKALLKGNHDDVMEQLNLLSKTVGQIASGIAGLTDISDALVPIDNRLSEQAIGILCDLSKSGGSTMLETNFMGGTEYEIMDGGGEINISEDRFVKDDLNSLVDLGVLSLDYNSKGELLYLLTRRGHLFANTFT